MKLKMAISSTTSFRSKYNNMARRRKPSFFKVLVGDFSTQLMVPPAFVKKYFGGAMPERAKLRGPDGKSSRVKVKMMDKNKCFFVKKGWKVFVEKYALEQGDFLVFHHIGNSKFYVKMYGKTACEKEYLLANNPAPSDQNGQKKSAMGANDQENGFECVETLEQFTSKYPYFKVIFKACHIQHRYMVVPASFAKKHVIKRRNTDQQDMDMVIQVGSKWWPVKLHAYTYKSVWSWRVYGGWSAFVNDNGLRQGDGCAFELIDPKEMAMKATIFRRSIAGQGGH